MGDPVTYTIADVAKAAGVSVSTVSRILNGKQDVAPATRERVQQVIKELGFAPHAQAKRLRAGKTRSIALLFPLKHPGNVPYNALDVDFILGAAASAGERDFLFNLVTTPVTQQKLLSFYRSAQVDGLILMHIHVRDWRVDLLRHNHYPFVMIGHCADNTGLDYVDLDFEGAVVAAFDHVISLGHRRIGFLALSADMHLNGYGPAVRAWAGYEQALRTHRLSPCYREVGFMSQDIFEATLELLEEDPGLTAIVTTYELASLSIIQALKQRGREVPDDCSLVAIMTERIGEVSSPAMTHIDFPSHLMGYKAVEMLIHRLEDELVEPDQILIPARLVIRNSTAPLRS